MFSQDLCIWSLCSFCYFIKYSFYLIFLIFFDICSIFHHENSNKQNFLRHKPSPIAPCTTTSQELSISRSTSFCCLNIRVVTPANASLHSEHISLRTTHSSCHHYFVQFPDSMLFPWSTLVIFLISHAHFPTNSTSILLNFSSYHSPPPKINQSFYLTHTTLVVVVAVVFSVSPVKHEHPEGL